jgi:predicted Zn-dependent peptidase
MKQIKEYSCGLRVAHQYISSVRSVAIGVHIGAGCIYETEENNGISHFIEHMVFKGTKTRTSFQIANEIDEIGANINASTSKVSTCFYTISINENAAQCMEF